MFYSSHSTLKHVLWIIRVRWISSWWPSSTRFCHSWLKIWLCKEDVNNIIPQRHKYSINSSKTASCSSSDPELKAIPQLLNMFSISVDSTEVLYSDYNTSVYLNSPMHFHLLIINICHAQNTLKSSHFTETRHSRVHTLVLESTHLL